MSISRDLIPCDIPVCGGFVLTTTADITNDMMRIFLTRNEAEEKAIAIITLACDFCDAIFENAIRNNVS